MLETKLRILQNNVYKNIPAMHTCLDIAFEQKIDYVLFQEPWINSDYTNTISHSSYYCIIPEIYNIRQRVLVFARKLSRFQSILRSDIFLDPDCLIIDIKDKYNQLETLQLINIYNQKSLLENEQKWTIERLIEKYTPGKNTILGGDFNLHHTWWNSEANNSSSQANKTVQWLESHDMELLNEPDQPTFFRKNLKSLSVIDLDFISADLNNKYIVQSQIAEEVSGSDHEIIKITIELNEKQLIENPLHSNQYKLDNVDWDEINNHISQIIKEKYSWCLNENTAQITDSDLEAEAIKLKELIVEVIEKKIPKKRRSEYSKPWWNDNLKNMRKEMAKAHRNWKENNSLYEIFQQKRNSYFTEIKAAKSACWNNFLENAEGKDIFKAFQYTKQKRIEKISMLEYQENERNIKAFTFEDKCKAFMLTLFKKPPVSEPFNWQNIKYQQEKWEWPEITKSEVYEAIFTSSSNKAPGPDGISFQIIQKIYPALEERFYNLFRILISRGYHPICWREAIGVVLKKPNRNATIPKGYRIISLLNCMGKIAEKIIATRLSYLAATDNLLYKDQLGGRKQYSAIDAVMSLVHDIQLKKHEKLKTSIVFIDVKGAFDHVSSDQLLRICAEMQIPLSIIKWLSCFLNKRSIQLAFDGEKQEKQDFKIGIPQGSPISPILFMIYIRNLFKNHEDLKDIRIPSYIDDIGLVASSKTIEENCKKLQKALNIMLLRQKENLVQFDMDKTELIHFGSQNTEKNQLRINSELVIEPKVLVKWLGIWLNSKLCFKSHVEKKIAAAERTLNQIIRLSNTERGLSFQAIRQLYIACITSIADYGVPIWWNNQKYLLKKYEKLQNQALRKILGAFKSSPIYAMEIEASIPPPKIRFKKICMGYALRTLQLQKSHVIRERVSSSFPPYSSGIELNWNKFLDWNEININNSRKKIPTQLFRNLSLIKELFTSLKTERIKIKWNAPWHSRLDEIIDINISLLSKKEEAKSHEKLVKELKNQDNILIYSDGSKSENNKVGAGVYMEEYQSHTSRKQYERYYWNLGLNLEVFDAELFAIEKSFKLAVQKYKKNKEKIKNIWIFSDSQAAIKRLRTKRLGIGLYFCQSIRQKAEFLKRENIKVHLHWVPAHMNIYGNEEADKAAKFGTELEKESAEKYVSLAFIKRNIKDNAMQEWLKNWQKVKSKDNHYSQFEKQPRWKASKLNWLKKNWSNMIQLKLGHGYFKSYLKRLPEYEDDRCLECGTKETPKHLLIECKKTKEIRKKWKNRMEIQELNMKFIFETKLGLKWLKEFATETKIATREWLLGL